MTTDEAAALGAGFGVDLDGGTPALRQMAAAVRRLTRATVRTGVDDATLREITAELDRASERLEVDMRDGPFRGDAERVKERGLPFHYNPVLGQANPYAPPVEVWVVDGEVHGTTVINEAYEGPPGYVHGGVLSLILDQTLGLANLAADVPGMTLGLSIRYLHPTPLNTHLEIRSAHEAVEGKNIRSVGSIAADGVTTVTAEGIFRAVPRAKGRRYFNNHFDR